MTSPMLLCVVSDDAPEAASALDSLVAELRLALPGVDVEVVVTDADGGRLEATIAKVPPVPSGLAVVIVPLVLADADAVARAAVRLSTLRADVVATAAWGNDARIVAVLLDRLAEAGVAPGSTVVLAVPCEADGDVPPFAGLVAEALRGEWDGPVRVSGVGDGPSGLERVTAAVHTARAYGEEGTVAVAALVLLPGEDHGVLAGLSADAVTAPLAPHPALVAAIAERYGALVRGASPVVSRGAA